MDNYKVTKYRKRRRFWTSYARRNQGGGGRLIDKSGSLVLWHSLGVNVEGEVSIFVHTAVRLTTGP